MTRIVITHCYKRPPKKRAKAAALEVPAIVTPASKRRQVSRRIETSADQTTPAAPTKVSTQIEGDDPQVEPRANAARKSAVVTARRPGTAAIPAGLLPDTPEEHRRRDDCRRGAVARTGPAGARGEGQGTAIVAFQQPPPRRWRYGAEPRSGG